MKLRHQINKPNIKNKWLQCVVAATVLLFSIGSPVYAGDANIATTPSAKAWLLRMGQTFQAANYSLSLIRVYQQHFEPVVIEHGVIDGEEIVHVNYLNGPEREILHRGGLVTYFQHDEPPYSVSGERSVGPIPQAFISGIEALEESYTFVLGGRNRVMGRAAQLIRIEPKDGDRYSLWVWLDADLGMLLRADKVSPSGEPLEHVQIVSTQYFEQPTPIIEKLAQVDMPAAVPLLEPDSASTPTRVKWTARYLPRGFKLLGRDRHRLGMTENLVDYQLYSDGISSISIYIGAAIDGKPGQSLVSQGATNLITIAKDGMEVAVIGTLPPETIKRIAEGVYPEAQSSNKLGKQP
ncbi:MucB/RseB C-terminal domain-containing protein [Echinimonas agarilytica]|uniref:MucB/RseB C-terminal domain-containing protein n=1 Tax=Echinimonas agarilytica TaxID=1215918 RepID=A0AA42B739_9GAMM|nr:MucB/RseB C-terminal domain-containing protein [Echinimonas agarilytica]MCM2678818.1 MucB/RseB C-terminal domain-containing protein [Echinimonas agarilytica]